MIDVNNIIYKVTNLVNGKLYIGLTTQTLRERRYGHMFNARNPHKGDGDAYFYNAIRKYGEHNFKWEVIEIAPNFDREEEVMDYLNEREVYWIALYDSYNNGYNLTKGGGGKVGFTFNHTEETKRKISESNMGRIMSKESRERISKSRIGRFKGDENPFFGKRHSEKVKAKISSSKKGISVHTEESKKKISKAMSGENHHSFGKGTRHRAIVQLTLEGEFVSEFPNTKVPATMLGKKDGSIITGCCKDRYKHAYGYRWMYKDEYENLVQTV